MMTTQKQRCLQIILKDELLSRHLVKARSQSKIDRIKQLKMERTAQGVWEGKRCKRWTCQCYVSNYQLFPFTCKLVATHLTRPETVAFSFRVRVNALVHADLALDILYLSFPILWEAGNFWRRQLRVARSENGACLRLTLSRCGLPQPVSAFHMQWKVPTLQTTEWFHACTSCDLLHGGYTSWLDHRLSNCEERKPELAIQTLSLLHDEMRLDVCIRWCAHSKLWEVCLWWMHLLHRLRTAIVQSIRQC